MVLPKMALARLVSRRRAMRGAIAGVLAVPLLGQVPGVSAASLDMDQ